MDEIALKRAVAKARKMQAFIESTSEVIEALEAELWTMFKASKSDEKDKREDIYREQHALRAIVAKLQKVVTEGRRAEEELKQQQVKYGE